MTKNSDQSHPSWLAAREWKLVQQRVPIACVDILPLRLSRSQPRRIEEIGLILRGTPHQGDRWCLVGGRMFHGETMVEAVQRQVRETLGSDARAAIKNHAQPIHVAEYFPTERPPHPLDPRQHSVGLTFALEIKGKTAAGGEALRFEWFDPRQLPRRHEFGFYQDRVVHACLKLLRLG